MPSQKARSQQRLAWSRNRQAEHIGAVQQGSHFTGQIIWINSRIDLVVGAQFTQSVSPDLLCFGAGQEVHELSCLRSIPKLGNHVTSTQHGVAVLRLNHGESEERHIFTDYHIRVSISDKAGDKASLPVHHSTGRIGEQFAYGITEVGCQYCGWTAIDIILVSGDLAENLKGFLYPSIDQGISWFTHWS